VVPTFVGRDGLWRAGGRAADMRLCGRYDAVDIAGNLRCARRAGRAQPGRTRHGAGDRRLVSRRVTSQHRPLGIDLPTKARHLLVVRLCVRTAAWFWRISSGAMPFLAS
jgi:hypothetical protein